MINSKIRISLHHNKKKIKSKKSLRLKRILKISKKRNLVSISIMIEEKRNNKVKKKNVNTIDMKSMDITIIIIKLTIQINTIMITIIRPIMILMMTNLMLKVKRSTLKIMTLIQSSLK